MTQGIGGDPINPTTPHKHAAPAVGPHGTSVAAGQRSARIVVTNLYNRLLPLIRYEITDEFTVAPTPCSCGSAYMMVADVEGRADDVFAYPGGLNVHPLNFRSILGGQPAIVE